MSQLAALTSGGPSRSGRRRCASRPQPGRTGSPARMPAALSGPGPWLPRGDYVSDEAEAAAVDRPDQALLLPAVADRLPRGHQPAVEGGLGDVLPGPDVFDQFILRHHPVVPLHEVCKHVENLRFEGISSSRRSSMPSVSSSKLSNWYLIRPLWRPIRRAVRILAALGLEGSISVRPALALSPNSGTSSVADTLQGRPTWTPLSNCSSSPRAGIRTARRCICAPACGR